MQTKSVPLVHAHERLEATALSSTTMRIAGLLAALMLTGCGYDFESYLDESAVPDSAATDTANVDSAAVDTGSADSSELDTGTAPPGDSAVADTTVPDVAVPDVAAPDVAAPDAGACTDAEGKVFGGHCYFPVGPTNWNNARTICAGRSAHLVTITSAAEEAFVETLRPGADRWIGFRRTGAMFEWITGEAASYTKWATGEPNGSGECARLRADNAWADQNCVQSEVALCERD